MNVSSKHNILKLKNLLIYILFFSFLISGLNHIFPYVDYVINKKEIIEKYCENKEKPKLKCDGKCHLRIQVVKKIKEEEKSSTNNPFNQPTKSFENFNPYCNKIVGLEKKIELTSKYTVSKFMHFQNFEKLSKNIDLPPPKFS